VKNAAYDRSHADFAIARVQNVSRETSIAAPPISLELALRAACVIEVNVPKPGNVHPESDAAGATYPDFLRSANAIAPVLAGAALRGVGPTVLEAVRATRRVVDHNTNLGIVLLLAPLAAVPPEKKLADGIDDVLANTTVDDARDVYEAIRLASPGGLGTVADQDVARPPSCTLVDAMRLAAERDLVARQYAGGFREVLDDGVPFLEAAISVAETARCDAFAGARGSTHASEHAHPTRGRREGMAPPHEFGGRLSGWQGAVVRLHLHLMSRYPDSLIARKCGRATAEEAARRAADVLSAGWPETKRGLRRCGELDLWLRADGNRRNPGTTADVVTACLFAAIRDRRVALSAT